MKDAYWRSIEVLRAVDGDTLDVRIDLGFRLSSDHRVRLLGINTPEKRGDTATAGREAQTFVEQWIAQHSQHNLFMRSEKADSFNRYLALIECGEGHQLCEELLAKGHAVVWTR